MSTLTIMAEKRISIYQPDLENLLQTKQIIEAEDEQITEILDRGSGNPTGAYRLLRTVNMDFSFSFKKGGKIYSVSNQLFEELKSLAWERFLDLSTSKAVELAHRFECKLDLEVTDGMKISLIEATALTLKDEILKHEWLNQELTVPENYRSIVRNFLSGNSDE